MQHRTHYLDKGGLGLTEICLPHLLGLKGAILSFRGNVKVARITLLVSKKEQEPEGVLCTCVSICTHMFSYVPLVTVVRVKVAE